MKMIKNTMVILGGLIGAVYVLNPGWGVFELIPDVIPVVGNLDEAAATALVINCLVYFRKRKAVVNEKDGPEEQSNAR